VRASICLSTPAAAGSVQREWAGSRGSYMKSLLRALIVEDSENDTYLLLRDLERSDYEIAHLRVETAEELNAALDRQSWDILFCDFSMPHFSGLTALEIVQ
jgi:CheY-like chemotaxis protein